MTERSLNVYENKGQVWKNVTAMVNLAKAGVQLCRLDSRLRGNER